MRRIAFLLAFALGIACAAVSHAATLQHEVGAYAVLPSDAAIFLHDGFTLDLTAQVQNPAPVGIHYLDAKPLKIIRPYEQALQCKLTTDPCPISTADKTAIYTAIKQRLAQDAANPAVTGIYVQDDYAGNVLGILQHVHQEARTYAPRLTVACGFGGTLDFLNQNNAYERDQASLVHYEQAELLNYSPSACDAPDLYIYSLGHRSTTSDYSMSTLLPVMLADLRAKGWDGRNLIGGPQAWEGYIGNAGLETGDSLATQTQAFCAAGAVAITAFTWDNFPDNYNELATNEDLVSGLQTGGALCRLTWGTG